MLGFPFLGLANVLIQVLLLGRIGEHGSHEGQ
jgi:hypothetical protein